MIVPTRRTLRLATIGIPISALPILMGPGLWSLWFIGVIGLLLAIAIAVWRLPRAGDLELKVRTPSLIHVGREEALTVEVVAHGKRPPVVEWFPRWGGVLTGEARAVSRGLDAWSLPLRPTRRGEAVVEAFTARWEDPLGLVARTVEIPIDRRIPVTPDIRSVREQALQFFTRRDFLSGLRMQRYLGEGSEFESLREYQPGLDPRGLDWKATARHRKLLVREFQAERNHPVIIAIDSGHLMREPIEGIPRLDHAINAALLFSFVALKSGDRVGLLSFDDRIREFLPPRRGAASFPRLQSHCSRIEYSDRETNFTLSMAELRQRVRRRSLVVCFTDFVDTITAQLMVENLKRLGSRHLLLFVGLRDSGLEGLRNARPSDALAVHRSVVAEELLRERGAVLAELRRSGIQCLDCTPAELSNALIAQYLRIRAREMVG